MPPGSCKNGGVLFVMPLLVRNEQSHGELLCRNWTFHMTTGSSHDTLLTALREILLVDCYVHPKKQQQNRDLRFYYESLL